MDQVDQICRVAERLVIPVTGLPDRSQEVVPCDDSFALFRAGISFRGSVRSCHEQAGADESAGIARAVIRFTAQILTEDHQDVVDVLDQLNAVVLGQMMAAHPHRPVRVTAV